MHPPVRPFPVTSPRSPRRPLTLALWRTRAPGAVRRADLECLAATLQAVALHDERRWRQARTWDAAEAIGIALRHLRRAGPSGARADLVMGSVMTHAVRGDAAACNMLSHALRQLGRQRRNARARRLARDWARWPRAPRSSHEPA